jgi:adenosyl cobinamide kinase/adenosyl cobinamide phosphate guanylyltransferase
MENNQKKVTLDSLATMIANRIDGMEEKMDAGFKEVKDEFKKVRDEIKEVKDVTENIQAEIIKKVDKVDHNTLIYRVEKLEKKFV